MKSFTLNATARTASEVGKKASKTLRKEGLIPAVLYGGDSVMHLSVTEDAVRNLIYTPEIFAIDLTVGDTTCKAILKDLQFHPVTDKVLHIDFLQVFEDKPVEMKVPIVLDGYAIGVKAGGKLTREKRYLKVKAAYTNIPEKLHINVSKLQLGKTIQVRQLNFEGLELMDAPNAVVCAVKLTRAARGKGATSIVIEEEDEESADGAEAPAAEE